MQDLHHILILCTHNSARSALAEALLNHWAQRLGRPIRAHSAGSAPSGRTNPHAISVLQRAGIDTSALRSKSWDEFTLETAPRLDAVITVCGSAAAETCPIWPAGVGGAPVQVHWGYPDPSSAPEAEREQAFELTRQALGYRLLQLLALPWQRMDAAARRQALLDIAAR
ncbi:arsenate reductase ArsC [Inhella gelatinilytica]|uniref:Arsenate reductase ArsC n=1 Tax=Inhella gelatinilytica TaxID=2795030 RepID=A0A931NDY0_9BURK|nr:arsenate reductase ArsC [Inhella gelatinilytica]MBH9551916.1 arsenate reductase ArsC [Inhella gelatinilytica]